MKMFSDNMRNSVPPTSNSHGSNHTVDISLIQDPEYRRLGCTIDFDSAFAKFNKFRWEILLFITGTSNFNSLIFQSRLF